MFLRVRWNDYHINHHHFILFHCDNSQPSGPINFLENRLSLWQGIFPTTYKVNRLVPLPVHLIMMLLISATISITAMLMLITPSCPH